VGKQKSVDIVVHALRPGTPDPSFNYSIAGPRQSVNAFHVHLVSSISKNAESRSSACGKASRLRRYEKPYGSISANNAMRVKWQYDRKRDGRLVSYVGLGSRRVDVAGSVERPRSFSPFL